ncbi:MAG TPA: SigE family RNA polymerase sigma factor [Mycobacteriales bacterium]|nr:SigE family RNA polymerase sigma factor [Mycobacteriales bacterium]
MRGELTLDDVYAASYRKLVAQLHAVTGSRQEAEDVVQEAFMRAIGRWDQIKEYDAPEAWLRTVALNLARSRWRRAVRGAAALVKHGVPAAEPELSPDHVALMTAMKGLPEAQREALVLHHFVGMSVDEVAAAVGAPSGTIKARLSRGRTALAGVLGMDEEALAGG